MRNLLLTTAENLLESIIASTLLTSGGPVDDKRQFLGRPGTDFLR
jgi:hypothetical protein